MLSNDELKKWLQSDLAKADKILLTLFAHTDAKSSSAIKTTAKICGCNMDSWNISSILSRAAGYTIRVPGGYEIGELGHNRLQEIGVSKLSPSAAKVAVDLRNHLSSITDHDTAVFLEEAIKCFEAGLYRSAIVMSWLAAVHILQAEVVKKHLAAFNIEAQKVDAKWKAAQNSDGLGKMSEEKFLDRISGISMIGKNVKEELAKALKLRNGCGHPNSLKVSTNMAAGHIELLLLNVFDRFCAAKP